MESNNCEIYNVAGSSQGMCKLNGHWNLISLKQCMTHLKLIGANQINLKNFAGFLRCYQLPRMRKTNQNA